MLISAYLKKTKKNWIADIPALQGATYCSRNEDIAAYVVDYLDGMGVKVEVLERSDKSLVMKVRDPRMMVGVMLKRLRGERTLSEVATKSLSRSMFHQYEQGRREASLVTISKLLATLGADFEIVVKRI